MLVGVSFDVLQCVFASFSARRLLHPSTIFLSRQERSFTRSGGGGCGGGGAWNFWDAVWDTYIIRSMRGATALWFWVVKGGGAVVFFNEGGRELNRHTYESMIDSFLWKCGDSLLSFIIAHPPEDIVLLNNTKTENAPAEVGYGGSKIN